MTGLGCVVICDLIYTHTATSTANILLFVLVGGRYQQVKVTGITRRVHIHTQEALCIMSVLSRLGR